MFSSIRTFPRRFRFWLEQRFKSGKFRHSIDTPCRGKGTPGTGWISGWVFAASGEKCEAVRACMGRHVWTGHISLYRPDVAELHPVAGKCSGFSIPYKLPPSGTHRIALEVLMPGGRWVQFARCKLTPGETPAHERVDYMEWMQKGIAARPPETPPADGPLISVLLPVHDPAEAWLRRAIESVLAQTYRRWELCIADDASAQPHVRTTLGEFASRDTRIKVTHRAVNGHICAASNSALELATGEFAALLDHDDELAPHALAEVAAAIASHPQANLIYSDEDKMDEAGRRYDPYFKPDWQPDLFLGQNYLSHLTVHRTALIRKMGGFRAGYEGSQDWDLALRVIESIPASGIIHIPQVLYHWRAIPGSTALGVGQKDYSTDAARRALADHLARTGQKAELLPVPEGHWRVRHPLPPEPPSVSLIIPTRNCAALLRTCVQSLLEKTAYPDFEIIIVDNGSDDADALAYFDELRGSGVKVIRDDGPFNFSALNNRAVQHATGKILGFLNNDLEVITPGWLGEMVSHAIRPGVGAVGSMLYYPNDLIQHAGIVLGIGSPQGTSGGAGHAMKDTQRGANKFMNHLRLVKNYSAVTAACLIVRRDLFEQLGGFDETNLAVAYNDVDFCLRALEAGHRNVWTPFAEFYHHESASRGFEDTPEKAARIECEFAYMRQRWARILDDDPAYNPNLTLVHEDFSLAWPPRPVAAARQSERFRRPA